MEDQIVKEAQGISSSLGGYWTSFHILITNQTDTNQLSEDNDVIHKKVGPIQTRISDCGLQNSKLKTAWSVTSCKDQRSKLKANS